MPPNGKYRSPILLTTKRASELLVTIKTPEEPTFTLPSSLLIVDPVFLLAKSYFDCKEYHRAAHVLTSTDNRSLFLKCYSLFLVCLPGSCFSNCERQERKEKLKKQLKLEVRILYLTLPSTEHCPVKNKELLKIEEELRPLHDSGRLDGYCLWVYVQQRCPP